MAVSGYVLVMLAYAVWAFSALFVKKAVSQHSPVLVTALAGLAGTLVLVPAVIAHREEMRTLPSLSWLWIIAAGVLWITIGQVLNNYGLERVDLSKAGLLALTFPIIATVLGALFLGEKMTLRFLLGSAVMAAGFFIVVL